MSSCGEKTCGGQSELHSSVSEFYAKQQVEAIKTGEAPCVPNCPLGIEAAPPTVTQGLALLHPDVKSSYFGCGMPNPDAVKGMKVLDLGSGTGRDCFLLSYLAGPQGQVTGIDMTPAMLEKAREMIPFHEEKFGWGNVDFRQGVLEELNTVDGLQPASFDIVISNCVINLTSDKGKVFKHAFDFLKAGGEVCFSDVYKEKPLPEHLKDNELIWNWGFGGSLPWDDFVTLVQEIGFLPPVVISSSDYVASQPELTSLVEGLKFWSVTCRLFKPNPQKEPASNTVSYKGTVEGCEKKFRFSDKLTFLPGVPTEVDEVAAKALSGSRFAVHFDFL